MTDVYVTLTPREQWKRAKSQDELVVAMAKVTDELPGMRAIYSQPIELRINEMVAGIRADLGIKVFGPDPAQLPYPDRWHDTSADQIEHACPADA